MGLIAWSRWLAAALALALVACGGSAAQPATKPASPAPAPTSAVAEASLVPAASPTPAPPEPAATEEVAPAASSTPVPVARSQATPAAAVVASPAPSPTASAPERPPPVTIAVAMKLAGRSFDPHQIHGNAGDTVSLTFSGGTEQHTFTVASLGIDVTIQARETRVFSFVMPVDGEVPFFCRFHGTPASGMHGLLIFH